MHATRTIPPGDWPASDTITLDYHHRHRRRISLTTDSGADLLLDLAETTHLRHDDGLDCGPDGIVRIIAAPEPLTEITAPPALLTRLAWHLGNRHLEIAFQNTSLLIRADHVIEAMAVALGATITHTQAPFDPESGAYAHDH